MLLPFRLMTRRLFPFRLLARGLFPRIIKPFNNSNMILHDLSSKERPGRRLDGVAGSFQHFSLSENPTTRSQVIGLGTVLLPYDHSSESITPSLGFRASSAHLLTL
ncbi:hypothetical protein L2E82_49729 [Cichorium intybus]|uniref:Uncharacterized protein n=1 Tax=Cichorium intybus TaxID=13427 RepID=A0ACB8Z1Y9_CICIN|nr:hypothetical protein L2E82_49729 [Cichorium intybus]